MARRVLSGEEEVELARSNKKIKEVHHHSASDGVNVGWGHGLDQGNAPLSFKEKLVGDIPRAYT